MRLIIFILLFSIVVFGGFSWLAFRQGEVVYQNSLLTPTPTATPISLSAERLWNLVQEWRDSKNLSRYTENKEACLFADERLKDAQKSFSHNGFSEKSKSLSFYRMGENLITGFPTEEETLDTWLNSPTHRENLDADYKFSCIKCEGTYCVQIFASY